MGIIMRLFWVTGNELRRYTESPALASRVEMPFSSTTASRVPAGTVILSEVPLWRGILDLATGPTAGGGEVCGPSGCCAQICGIKSDIAPAKVTPPYLMIAIRLLNVRFMGHLPRYFWSDAVAGIEDAQSITFTSRGLI